MKYLIVDAGNTRIKVAYFSNDEIQELTTFDSEDLNALFHFISQKNHDYALLSSVLKEEETVQIENRILKCINLKKAIIPIKNKYNTPKTLGADRIANAVASVFKADGNRLIIDLGTCIKFDFVDSTNSYQGGSISLGMNMRFKALNEFTGNLPLLSYTKKSDLIGKDTNSSIYSGVLNGIQEEINGFIAKYEAKYPSLTIFVTGGDHLNFDYSSKNNIFADENLTLFGLLQILKANV
ncbi:MAG: type III pantothenate kinase [Flavobacteriia bacterium]|jgi:type III pantothenate kinase